MIFAGDKADVVSPGYISQVEKVIIFFRCSIINPDLTRSWNLHSYRQCFGLDPDPDPDPRIHAFD